MFEILESAHYRKSFSQLFLEIQSISRAECGMPTTCQSIRTYLRLTQMKWFEVLHPFKSKSLSETPVSSLDLRVDDDNSLPFLSISWCLWEGIQTVDVLPNT